MIGCAGESNVLDIKAYWRSQLLVSITDHSGCSSVGGDVFAGRNALQTGRPRDAIDYLVQAVDANPNYKLSYRTLPAYWCTSAGHTSKLAETQKLDKRSKESSSIKTIRLGICTLGSRCQSRRA
jgi:hypothetical protein